VEGGDKIIDAAADLLELQALIAQQQQLLTTQTALQQQLLRLQGEDPDTLAQWQQILANLYGNAAVEHAAFLNFLAAHGLSQKDVTAKALANATAVSPKTASRVALGMSVVDPSQLPDNLAAIPGINPDFIAALKCDREGIQDLMNGGDGMVGVACARCRVGDPCDRYADGSYIKAFGPPSYDPTRAGVSTGQIAGMFRSKQAAPNFLGSAAASTPSAANKVAADANSRLSDEALRASLLAAGKAAVPQIEAWMRRNPCYPGDDYPTVQFKDVIVPTDDGNNRDFYQYGMPTKEKPIIGWIRYTYYDTCPNGPPPRLNGPIPWKFLYDGTHWEADWSGRTR